MNREGTLETVDGRHVLRFERRLAHPVERVWRAVTETGELARWFPGRLEIEPVRGGTVRWTFPEDGTELPPGTVTAFDPPRLLEFTTPGEGGPLDWATDETLRIELTPVPGGCLLVFVQAFGDRPGAASFASGWHFCLDGLEAALDGREVAVPDGAEAVDRHEDYVERFGLGTGRVEESPDGWEVRFERQFMSPVDRVWAELTAPHAEAPDAGTAVGGPPAPRLANGYVDPGEVTAAAAPRTLEYRWLSRGGPAGLVRWELADGPGGARVVLTQTFPRGSADERAAALAAWHTHLELLADHLRGQTRCPWPQERTEELHTYYAAQLER